MNRLYLTPEELALRYKGKVSVRTLANWRSMGISPPFTKIGGRILYPLSELLLWEGHRTVVGTSGYGKAVAVVVALVGWMAERSEMLI